ncbi:MAG: TonB-dependent receptor [Verrucomicrobiota bacterium]
MNQSVLNPFSACRKKVLWLAVYFLLASPFALLAQKSKSFEFALEAQPMVDALEIFSKTTGIDILARSSLLKGRSAPALNGTYQAEEALEMLLSGTDLTLEFVSETSAAIRRPARAEPADTGGVIEFREIVLTGELVDRSLRETPNSVVAYDAVSLGAIGNELEINSVLDRIPNLSIIGGNQGLTIRGQQATGALTGGFAFFAGSTPRATTYIDGRPTTLSELNYGHTPLWDVEQVEVFRGPVTTARGANSIAGAVFINSQDPVFYPDAKTRAALGSFGLAEFSAMANSPIIEDELAVRATVYHSERESFVDFVNLDGPLRGRSPDSIEALNLRAKALYTPKAIPGLEAKLTFARQENEGMQAEQVSRDETLGIDYEDRISLATDPSFWKNESDSVIADLSYERENGLKVTTSLMASKLDANRSTLEGDFFVDSEDLVSDTLIEYAPVESSFSLALGSFIKLTDEVVLLEDVTGVAAVERIDDEKESYGFTGEINWDATETLSFSAGLRHQEDEQIRYAEVILGFLPFRYEQDSSAWLPRFVVSYELNEDITVGGLVSRGYNPGGGSASFLTLIPYTYDEEYVWNYEAFLRGAFFEEKLILNANLFYSLYDDAQRNYFTIVPDGSPTLFGVPVVGDQIDSRVVNVGEAVSYGAEIQATYLFSDQFNVFANIALLNTEVTDSGIEIEGIPEIEGNQFAYAPEFTASFGLDWQMIDSLKLGVSGKYSGGHFSGFRNDPDSKSGGHFTFDANVSYQRTEGVRVFAYAANLLDEFATTSEFGFGAYVNKPRQIGVGLEVDF